MYVRIIFLWIRGNAKKRGRAKRSFCSCRNTKPQNFWPKILPSVKINCYWKIFCISIQLFTREKNDFSFSSLLYELLQVFIHTRKVIMSKHQLCICQQLLQKASILMTERECNCVHNLKCCFLVVLVEEELKEMKAIGRRFYFLYVVCSKTRNAEPVPGIRFWTFPEVTLETL